MITTGKIKEAEIERFIHQLLHCVPVALESARTLDILFSSLPDQPTATTRISYLDSGWQVGALRDLQIAFRVYRAENNRIT